MDEEAVRAVLRHYSDCSATDEDVAYEIYHEDAVLEFPPSRKRALVRRRDQSSDDLRARTENGRLWDASVPLT